MKATQLLKKQHKEVSSFFKQIKKAEGLSEKKALFKQLATLLVSHDGIEREIFYPACEAKMGLTDALGEALVEHGQIEFALFLTDEATAQDFDFKCTVLQEIVDHHVEEEEDEFFPKVEKKIELQELKTLGEKMEVAFVEKTKKNFRQPLHNNLKQVLRGIIKPEPSAGDTISEQSSKFSGNGRPTIL